MVDLSKITWRRWNFCVTTTVTYFRKELIRCTKPKIFRYLSTFSGLFFQGITASPWEWTACAENPNSKNHNEVIYKKKTTTTTTKTMLYIHNSAVTKNGTCLSQSTFCTFCTWTIPPSPPPLLSHKYTYKSTAKTPHDSKQWQLKFFEAVFAKLVRMI